MAKISSVLFVAAISSLVIVCSVNFVDGKTIAKAKRQHDLDLNCVQRVAFCALPLMILSQGQDMESALRHEVLENGLGNVCEPLNSVKSCMIQQLGSCGRDEIPPDFLKAVGLLKELIGFICETEFDSINADRACLFGDELDRVTDNTCGEIEPSGDVCSLTSDMECSVRQYEETCGNPRFAARLRAFAKKLERESGCDKSKVSLRWLQVAELLQLR